MAKFKGRDLLVQRGDGGSPENFTTVGALRSTGVTINNEQVDVSNKSDGSWRQMIEAGIRSLSISASGVFTDDTQLAAMLSASVTDDATIENYKIVSGVGDVFQGAFQIASMERTGEYNGAEEYSVTLESSGTIVYTPAP